MKRFHVVTLALVLAMSLGACSKSSQYQDSGLVQTGAPALPTLTGKPDDQNPGFIQLNNGARVVVHSGAAGAAAAQSFKLGKQVVTPATSGAADKRYVEIEATLAPVAFARLKANPASVRGAIDEILKRAKKVGAIPALIEERVGYFTFLLPLDTSDLLGALKGLNFPEQTYINPVSYDLDSLKTIRALTPAGEELPAPNPRADISGYSGLDRIHAPEFVRLVEAELGDGARIDGSTVRLGITDTGITYNHPAFDSPTTGKNRVIYMKDFTREGRVYFNPNAKFEVVAADEENVLTIKAAEIIVTPKLPNLPAADVLTGLKPFQIGVSPELKALLTSDAGKGAKIGILFETAFESPDEKADINGNGQTTDVIPVIFVPSADPAQVGQVYVAWSGELEFYDKPLRDWNSSGDTANVFAEKIGFHIQKDKLPNKDGETVGDVISASIVGFDPGNHGSHVAGIAAGGTRLVRGVAPEAAILMNRVCSNNAGCGATAAMIDMVVNGKANLVNMSLGGLSPFNDGYGVQETIANRMAEIYDSLFIISAGNSGPGRQTVGAPSVARHSLSVGASASKGMIQRQYQWPGSGATTEGQDDDFMLFFSSRGPTAAGGFKPNISAPGTELSAVQLNSAPGARAGADVYWGTSMAAPTAAGGYALLLDAINKYNKRNPDKALSTDALVLRSVLMESARPFDVNKFEPASGLRTAGQYSWIDQGSGMMDLTAAWAKLKQLRDAPLDGEVKFAGKSLNLDYQVLVKQTNPLGQKFDGSDGVAIDPSGTPKAPRFGTGLYLNFYGEETLKAVHIARGLKEKDALLDEGQLTRQLVTTADEFVLKTTIYGSDKQWLKVGVLDQLECLSSGTANLTVIGRGAQVTVKPDGTGELAEFKASNLNICLDREMMKSELPSGDHGALISAYRVVGGKQEVLPSFIVPVYVTVPHKTLAGSTGYEISRQIKSFQVDRNYITVPKGATMVRVTLEVPPFKRGEACSGVELMALEGGNTVKPSETRPQLRVGNCDEDGTPSDKARVLTLTRTQPRAGIWDLHVNGRYKFANSSYKLKVDYLVAESSVSKIEGDLTALTGSFHWTIKESSIEVAPDLAKSTYTIDSLRNRTDSKLTHKQVQFVESPLGVLRAYPEGTTSVTLTTGGSPGNDIDMIVVECAAGATSPEDATCAAAGSSGGSTDEESVTFEPKAGKVYALRAEGYDIKNEGKFYSWETIKSVADKGVLTISGTQPDFLIGFTMAPETIEKSKLIQSPLFQSGKYLIGGSVDLRTAQDVVLGSIGVSIKK